MVQPAEAQGVLPDAVLKKIKRATVHLKVKLASGTDVEGSGWFVEPGLIATNAHVVGLQGQEARLPLRIDAVIDSGEPGSRTLVAKFAGGDIDADLAVLRVIAEDLPEPLKMGSTTDLVETQEVLVFGFPFGRQLGKAITVGKTSVTSLRKVAGVLNEIQVNGGISPGNSGGPVVNLRGEVVGIAVSGIAGTTINMAVPVDKLSRLLNGRVVGFTTQSSIIENGQIRIPIRVTVLDPFKRVKNLQVEHWIGSLAKISRPASGTRPEPVAGDRAIQTVDFTYDGKTAYANCDVPVEPLPEDTVSHWLRVTYVDGLEKPQWTTAVGLSRIVPAERREITMKFQPPTGAAAPMQITNDSTFKVQFGKKSDTNSMQVRVITNPTYLRPTGPDGDIPLKWKFTSVSLGMRVNGESVNVKEKWVPLANNMLKIGATLEFADNGSVVNSRVESGKVEQSLKSTMNEISEHLLQSVEVLSVPLPDGPLRPLDRLRVQRTLLIGLPGMCVPAQADIRYQYLGVRTVSDGTQTAAFELSGILRPRRGDEAKIGGRLTGGVDLLLATGEIHAGNTNVLVDMELTEAGPIRLQGSLSIDYRRPAASVTSPAVPDDKKPKTEPATDAKPASDAAKPATTDAAKPQP